MENNWAEAFGGKVKITADVPCGTYDCWKEEKPVFAIRDWSCPKCGWVVVDCYSAHNAQIVCPICNEVMLQVYRVNVTTDMEMHRRRQKIKDSIYESQGMGKKWDGYANPSTKEES